MFSQVKARAVAVSYKRAMPPRNYSGTAVYFERRAAKAAEARRREHLQSIAKLYHEKARAAGESSDSVGADAQAPSRRNRVAAMFRAFGDSSGVVRHAKRDPGETRSE
jgi:hypothetical protein